MKLPRRRFLHLAAGAAALPAVSRVARAQSLSDAAGALIIAATAPGGAPDIVARLIGQWLSERLGQQFIIENRPGGGTNIGTEAVVRAPPDGYTLLLVEHVERDQRDALRQAQFQFHPRHRAGRWHHPPVPLVMVVNPSVPAKTVPEFIAYAKANPGKINFGSPGIGTPGHVAGELVQDDGRGQHGSRAVSRRGTRDDRSARRTGAGSVRHHVSDDRARSGPASCVHWR